jgi:hypothetical protein
MALGSSTYVRLRGFVLGVASARQVLGLAVSHRSRTVSLASVVVIRCPAVPAWPPSGEAHGARVSRGAMVVETSGAMPPFTGELPEGATTASHNLSANTDALRRPAAAPRPGASRRLPLRYVAWPTRDFGSRFVAWLRVSAGATWLAHALVGSHAPVGRSRHLWRASSELGLAFDAF